MNGITVVMALVDFVPVLLFFEDHILRKVDPNQN